MSNEFLKRCRRLADVNIDRVIKTVHGSPAYSKLLKHAEGLQNQITDYERDADINKERIRRLEATVRVLQADLRDHIPPELFDGFSVLKNVNNKAVEGSILAGTVSDVLDAVVRMIRERIASGD